MCDGQATCNFCRRCAGGENRKGTREVELEASKVLVFRDLWGAKMRLRAPAELRSWGVEASALVESSNLSIGLLIWEIIWVWYDEVGSVLFLRLLVCIKLKLLSC